MADDDILDAVLDGLADELELERELGVRAVEIDRSLLAAPRPAAPARPQPPVSAPPPAAAPSSPPAGRRVAPPPPRPPSEPVSRADAPDGSSDVPLVAFVHDRPLSPKAVTMMAKTVVALGYAGGADAPVVVTRPIPKARRYVFLGSRALRAYLPGTRAEENARFQTPKGVEALLVKSPEDIVRFETETPALRREKEAMWRALKSFARNRVP